MHLEQRRPRRRPLEARIAVAGDGLPHAVRGHARPSTSRREPPATRAAVRRRRVRRRLPARPPAGRARRALRAGLLRQRPAVGRPQATSPTTATTPARATSPIAALLTDLKRRGLLDETLVIWGGEFGRTPTTSEGAKRPRPQRARLHDVAGRRRRQGRPCPTARPTTSASPPSRTRSTCTTCTPPSCTCWASTTRS